MCGEFRVGDLVGRGQTHQFLAGPAGTIAGGAGGGYAGSQAWDASVGKLMAAMERVYDFCRLLEAGEFA